jgi:hypothetical protein
MFSHYVRKVLSENLIGKHKKRAALFINARYNERVKSYCQPCVLPQSYGGNDYGETQRI